ncbi:MULTISPECIES: PTS IIA-like nitrogen regulatory protein PtsN [unclassified Oceanobacter]|jgi:PTS system nitrogen regulatory IIA component|uniref:PTS IIA-like nitrogen regulatory protein PtsN n=1 Tax=unclassified Oceanobacter TaxID=2620260 RepID=UPI0026E128E3|nr:MULTISPECIES: PTS IIA-like nitrogen regulatory protein PtsN [unclassified Oceanobacter]MDO6804294.1 PTS IIA-like nitrogen regulatory protein PtsN [Wenyingzhuangia sp. 1_MG-2023]MDO6681988.1 PTS IIA-like nitrogen regulatory protein PtsN [Oceanobacter sp. 5_MG-2023]MDP2505350.1 PTS IIA-like nitrogen regulatory protein PtsN [Oceanobacter sp. 3_MG-2023]MDP2548024.1 PTS IIA-like nitrogen regulatory protein PtsN [Oceanobacter sp. 4_MG-2023]MDP2610122.1 PTS IIA-like nitrogen regulatory protein Pts
MSIAIADILLPECTRTDVAITSKKKLLEFLAGLIAEKVDGSSSDEVFERLLGRERLGSTGIGEGIAIPHCRLRQCEQAVGVLLHLQEAIDFDAIDHQPVDLVFALLVPEEATDDHLQILATLAQNFSQNDYRQQLRSASSDQELYQRALANH